MNWLNIHGTSSFTRDAVQIELIDCRLQKLMATILAAAVGRARFFQRRFGTDELCAAGKTIHRERDTNAREGRQLRSEKVDAILRSVAGLFTNKY